ncbi:MAG: DUF975 family protein [Bacteroidia bacterium]
MKNSIQTSNSDLVSIGKDLASINWGQAIAGSLLIGLVSAASGILPVISLIVGGPLMLGYCLWSLKIVREEEFKLDYLFDGFKNFGNSVGTYLLNFLLVILWSLLLIIPGIIKALAYSQSMFILADEPEIGPMEALRKSEAMMKGYKTKYFLLGLIFMLLSIACIFTLGIGFFFLMPVMQITMAKFYEEVRANYTGEEYKSTAEADIEQIGSGE